MGNEWRRRLNCPKLFFRRAKSMTVTLKELLAEALESRLDATRSVRDGKAAAPKWKRAYGALRHLRHERKAIERAIETEFEAIEPDCSSTARVFSRLAPC
jgi:hypothetical protein